AISMRVSKLCVSACLAWPSQAACRSTGLHDRRCVLILFHGRPYRAVRPRFTWSPAARTLQSQFENESAKLKFAHREPEIAALSRLPPNCGIPYEPYQLPRPLPEYADPPTALYGAPITQA